MNFAEWATVVFLPLAVMSDFSQLSSTSGVSASEKTLFTESNDGLIVFASQAIAEKCSYCPPLNKTEAVNPVLVDCDIEQAMTFDRTCFFDAMVNGEPMGYQIPNPNPHVKQPYCNTRGKK